MILGHSTYLHRGNANVVQHGVVIDQTLALLKGHLVGDWFMGLCGLRGPWRWVVAIWLLLPGLLIALAFFLSYRD